MTLGTFALTHAIYLPKLDVFQADEKMSTELHSEVPMMSLPLAYCLVIAPTNIQLKSFKTSGSSISILSTSPDSEITSNRKNLERSERYKRKVK